MARPQLNVTLPDIPITKDDVRALMHNPAFLHICQVAAERETKYLDLISVPELPSEQRTYYCGRRAGLMEFIEGYLSVIFGRADGVSTQLDKTRSDVVEATVESVRSYIMQLAGVEDHGEEERE